MKFTAVCLLLASAAWQVTAESWKLCSQTSQNRCVTFSRKCNGKCKDASRPYLRSGNEPWVFDDYYSNEDYNDDLITILESQANHLDEMAELPTRGGQSLNKTMKIEINVTQTSDSKYRLTRKMIYGDLDKKPIGKKPIVADSETNMSQESQRTKFLVTNLLKLFFQEAFSAANIDTEYYGKPSPSIDEDLNSTDGNSVISDDLAIEKNSIERNDEIVRKLKKRSISVPSYYTDPINCPPDSFFPICPEKIQRFGYVINWDCKPDIKPNVTKYPHPKKCNVYYQLRDGINGQYLEKQYCEDGTVYSDWPKTCVFPHERSSTTCDWNLWCTDK